MLVGKRQSFEEEQIQAKISFKRGVSRQDGCFTMKQSRQAAIQTGYLELQRYFPNVSPSKIQQALEEMDGNTTLTFEALKSQQEEIQRTRVLPKTDDGQQQNDISKGLVQQLQQCQSIDNAYILTKNQLSNIVEKKLNHQQKLIAQNKLLKQSFLRLFHRYQQIKTEKIQRMKEQELKSLLYQQILQKEKETNKTLQIQFLSQNQIQQNYQINNDVY